MSALLFAKIGSLDNAREAYSGATAFNFQLSLEGRPTHLRFVQPLGAASNPDRIEDRSAGF